MYLFYESNISQELTFRSWIFLLKANKQKSNQCLHLMYNLSSLIWKSCLVTFLSLPRLFLFPLSSFILFCSLSRMTNLFFQICVILFSVYLKPEALKCFLEILFMRLFVICSPTDFITAIAVESLPVWWSNPRWQPLWTFSLRQVSFLRENSPNFLPMQL